jgi:predicted nucleotidyltransferase
VPTTTPLPPDVQQSLDSLVAALTTAAGDDLLGVALYGGLAKGRYTPGISDINVLVVVRQAGLDTLERLAPALTAARREGRISSLVVTPDDLREMARLFPVKIADIKAAHRVLRGAVRLSDIEFDMSALRMRAIQELANAELRMRQRAVDHAFDPGAMWAALTSDLPKLAVTLETVLRLRGTDLPPDRAAVLRIAGQTLGIPADTMQRFGSIHRHESRPSDEIVRTTAGDYLRLLGTLRERVGTLEPGLTGETAPRRSAPRPNER